MQVVVAVVVARCTSSYALLAAMSPKRNTTVSTEDLITEVERRPPIWNVTLKEYGDKAVRKQLWNEIVNDRAHRSSTTVESEDAHSSELQEKDPLDFEYRPYHRAKKKKIKVEVEEPVVAETVSVADTNSREPQEDSESDKLFLLSLLDGFRRIPDAYKSAAKIDMIKLIEKYQNTVFYAQEADDDLTGAGVGSTSDPDFYARPPSAFSDHSNDSIRSEDFKL
nr:unnamed protein product [Callosobruchus analis]